jgi:hypothetical protein
MIWNVVELPLALQLDPPPYETLAVAVPIAVFDEYDGVGERLKPGPVTVAVHGVCGELVNQTDAGHETRVVVGAAVITIGAVFVTVANRTLPSPQVTVSTYDPTLTGAPDTGASPSVYERTGMRPSEHVPLPGCGVLSNCTVVPVAPAVGVLASADAVNVPLAGTNVTPAGTSPPTAGVATTVLLSWPTVGPIVQQT